MELSLFINFLLGIFRQLEEEAERNRLEMESSPLSKFMQRCELKKLPQKKIDFDLLAQSVAEWKRNEVR